jgi:hypothetical protein
MTFPHTGHAATGRRADRVGGRTTIAPGLRIARSSNVENVTTNESDTVTRVDHNHVCPLLEQFLSFEHLNLNSNL